jgi:serine/threonine protein kinase
MSPERISGLQYTTKSDVWALGMILMECLVGKFPYHVAHESESYERLLGRIVDDHVPLHLMRDHGVPALVAQLVSRSVCAGVAGVAKLGVSSAGAGAWRKTRACGRTQRSWSAAWRRRGMRCQAASGTSSSSAAT